MAQRPFWRPRGLIAGALVGVLAVVSSGLLTPAGAPPAYGICVACHGRDLLAGLGLRSWVGGPAAGGLVLTTVGIMVGAVLAAALNGELRRRRSRQPVLSLVLGALTMCAALLALGCTTRLALRVAYGDGLAVWSLVGVALAITAVTRCMAWYARRGGGASC